MTGEERATQGEPRTPFEGTPFEAMMSWMSQQDVDCDCAEMMSQMMGQQETFDRCAGMMSQMMAMCGGVQVPAKADEGAKGSAQVV